MALQPWVAPTPAAPTVQPGTPGVHKPVPVDWAWRELLGGLEAVTEAAGAELWYASIRWEDPVGVQARETIMAIKEQREVNSGQIDALHESFGIAVSNECGRFMLLEVTQMEEIDFPIQYREIQWTPKQEGDCPICSAPHEGEHCADEGTNYPRIPEWMPPGWSKNVKGVIIGSRFLREQPPALREEFPNLSFGLSEDWDSRLFGKRDQASIEETGLYRALMKRVNMVIMSPHISILVEYSTRDPTDILAGGPTEMWDFCTVVREAQSKVLSPIIILGVCPPPKVGADENQLHTLKEHWITATKKMNVISRAAGVGFIPLLTHCLRARVGNRNLLIGDESFKKETLFSSTGRRTRELYRRQEIKIRQISESMEEIKVTLEAINRAQGISYPTGFFD